MSEFAGIETAEVSGKLPNLRAGTYLFQIDAVKMVKSRSKGAFFVVEVTILEAQGEGANEVGSRASWMVKMSLDNALGNIKGFVAALTNEPLTAVTSSLCDELVAEDQPAKGERVRAHAFIIKTKSGNDFTKVDFSHFAEPQAAAA